MSNWRRPCERQQTKDERSVRYFFLFFGLVMACFGFLGIYIALTATSIPNRKGPVAALALALVGVVMFGASLSELIKTRRRR
jgi:succinate dehydrogenase/fumarate reductase cytochrome b subunit